MSRKDYQLIADVIRDSYGRQEGNTTKIANARRMELREVAYRFSVRLSADNPSFDSDRFIDACGVESSH